MQALCRVLDLRMRGRERSVNPLLSIYNDIHNSNSQKFAHYLVFTQRCTPVEKEFEFLSSSCVKSIGALSILHARLKIF